MFVRDRVDALLDPGFAVPGALAARRPRHVRRRGARRRARHRDRPRRGTRGDGHRQRRDGQGRDLLPDDGQEAPARPGDRRAEPAAVRLPGRFGRRLPSAAGGGLSGPRALRAHLLQPGAHVGRADPADRRRDGLLHGGRRLRARDVGRGRHRQGHGDDLSGGPAARQGRDGRGGHRGGARRRRRAHAALRRRGPPRRGRRARARDRALARREPARRASRCRPTAPSRRSRPTTRRRSTASSRATCASPTTCAR